MGKKSKLKKEAETVKSLVKETNAKIEELGSHDRDLYQALVQIQEQFDKIRNVPSDKQLEYQTIKKVSMTWKQHVDRIESDYEIAKKTDIGGGAAGASLGIGVAAFGPTAAMGIATTYGVASTGTLISSLSGAAATNAALAWLGGGALSAGGGGMVAGEALLGLAGPVGWAIAGISIISSIVLFWKAKSQRNRLTDIFLLISHRDQNSYKQAIVELNERIKRIKNETFKLQEAINSIKKFGTDYNLMSESQQYILGSFVNLMNASTQLLVSPILGLQPKYTKRDLDSFIKNRIVDVVTDYSSKRKDLIVYLCNLLYKITTDEHDRKLLSKSFRGNKNFRKEMKLEKSDINLDLFNTVNNALNYLYHTNSTPNT